MASSNGVVVSDAEADALDFLVQHTQTRRTSLAANLGITPQGTKDVVERLKGRGLDIVETNQATGRGGQPAKIYELNVPECAFALAVDIGYHAVRVAACRPDGQLLADTADRQGYGLMSGHSPAEVFDVAADSIRELLSERGSDDLVGIGVAVAGPIDPREHMLRSGADPGAWEDADFAKEIRERLPMYTGLKIEVDNDANLGALAEHRTGAASGWNDVVYVRWTAGIGAGLVLDGRLYTGATGIAGELGHSVTNAVSKASGENGSTREAPGAATEIPVCRWCGERCLQAVAGTDAIIADAVHRGAKLDAPTIREVIAATPRDEAATEAIQTAASHLGRALAIVVDVLNPGIVVLGGAFGRDQYRLVVPKIQDAMREATIQPSFRDARIVMAVHSAAHLGGSVIQGAATRVFDLHLATWLMVRAVPA